MIKIEFIYDLSTNLPTYKIRGVFIPEEERNIPIFDLSLYDMELVTIRDPIIGKIDIQEFTLKYKKYRFLSNYFYDFFCGPGRMLIGLDFNIFESL